MGRQQNRKQRRHADLPINKETNRSTTLQTQARDRWTDVVLSLRRKCRMQARGYISEKRQKIALKKEKTSDFVCLDREGKRAIRQQDRASTFFYYFLLRFFLESPDAHLAMAEYEQPNSFLPSDSRRPRSLTSPPSVALQCRNKDPNRHYSRIESRRHTRAGTDKYENCQQPLLAKSKRE